MAPSDTAFPGAAFGEVGRLADEIVRLGLRLAETAALMTLAAQYAWLDAWVGAHRRAAAGLRETRERQARTDRLISRGVPPDLAARGLRLV